MIKQNIFESRRQFNFSHRPLNSLLTILKNILYLKEWTYRNREVGLVNHFCLFEMVIGEVGKNIHFDRLRVNQRRHSQLLTKIFCSNTASWRSDFNKEFGICILNMKRSKIPRSLLPGSARSPPPPTAIPATWLRQGQPPTPRPTGARLFSWSKRTIRYVPFSHHLNAETR